MVFHQESHLQVVTKSLPHGLNQHLLQLFIVPENRKAAHLHGTEHKLSTSHETAARARSGQLFLLLPPRTPSPACKQLHTPTHCPALGFHQVLSRSARSPLNFLGLRGSEGEGAELEDEGTTHEMQSEERNMKRGTKHAVELPQFHNILSVPAVGSCLLCVPPTSTCSPKSI